MSHGVKKIANRLGQACPICKAKRYERCFKVFKMHNGESYHVPMDDPHAARPPLYYPDIVKNGRKKTEP